MNTKLLLIISSIIVTQVGCAKFVDVKAPDNRLTGASAFDNDVTAASVMTGLYAKMSNSQDLIATGQLISLSDFASLSADELSLWSGSAGANGVFNQSQYYYYTNALFNDGSGQYGSEFWGPCYNAIYTCNSVIEGLSAAGNITLSVKQQLLGEAKFNRALNYFYLTNLYGGVPIALTTDYTTNSSLPRAAQADVYKQIVSDLKDAEGLLSSQYLDGTLLKVTAERVRPTTWAASALLARVYLFTKDWADAESEATTVIGNSATFDTVSLNGVFKANSKEAIWQLQPVISGWNTQDGRLFIIPSTGLGLNNTVYLSNTLYNIFESGDNRLTDWVDSVVVTGTTYYYPYKYKSATLNAPVTEYQMMLRLGEQYLIRAEARAEQNNLTGAIADLDIIRQRAGLPLMANTNPGIDQAALLDKILHERQVELFTEFGHRWLDLKRTGTVDAVMGVVTPQKSGGGAWQSYQQLYPIPYKEVQANPNLKQNSGF